MKYLDKGRNYCEDTGEQEISGSVLYVGFFCWNYLCQSDVQRLYYVNGDF